MEYRPLDFEEKWMETWATSGLYRTDDTGDRPKYYVLEMFPYPSGRLHIGHVRNYTIGDCVARFKRMSGFNVLHPPGFDSFGLPAENAAIKNNLDPEKWTIDNIAFMIGQQKRLGLAYDWDRLVVTCKENYYRWNQWIFIKMMERGLVYRKKGWVNWDPVDQTVLANEQVIDGKGWRSGAEVEKREIEQWYIRITDYAEELLTGLDQLDGWPDRVKIMQRHWIGRSEGAEVLFRGITSESDITVYTTRPDTLFGVTYVVLAPEHPLTMTLARSAGTQTAVSAYIQAAMAKSVIERGDAGAPKTGMALGVTVINPMTQEPVPVYVSDYVLMDYGTGAVMAVPAHDHRDFEFATAYNLPVKIVIQPNESVLSTPLAGAYTDPGILVNSGPFDGVASGLAKGQIVAGLESQGTGKSMVKYRLRDWLISRQRCWGTPIPVAYDDAGNCVPIPESQLPVRLPKDIQFSGKGNPLENSPSFREIELDGKRYRRETDTMDTFFDSSWYFFRYCDPQNESAPFSASLANHWGPVDQYIGGIEHAVLHLLYARFFSKVLRDLGMHSIDEPFKHLLCQGMVIKDGAKMSKSLGNVVDPSDIISKYGADTARLFILFGAPVERDLDWSAAGVEGAYRFIGRVFRMVTEFSDGQSVTSPAVVRMTHKTIKAVSDDVARFSFNTAISRMMEMVNFMSQSGTNRAALTALVQLISPFAPFAAEELWQFLGRSGSVHQSQWPTYDPALTVDETVTLVVQINGKVRDKIETVRGMTQTDAEALVRDSERIQKFVAGQTVVNVVYVPDRLLNLVLK